jgi:hypothetical protein
MLTRNSTLDVLARMGTYVWTEAYDMPADEPVLILQTGLASDLGSHLATPSGAIARLITQTGNFSRAKAMPGNRGNR